MATIGSVTTSLNLESAAFIRDLNKATTALNNNARKMSQQTSVVQAGFTRAASAAKTLALGIAGIATGVGLLGLTRLVRGAIDTADALGKTADKVGVTVAQLQSLRFAAERTGGSQRALDLSLQRFSRRIGEAAVGTGELKKSVEQYNIQLRNADGSMRPVVAILRDYADAVKGATSPQEQLRLAVKAFDSEGAVFVNLLREGADGIDRYAAESGRLGQITDENTRAAARANDALTSLSTTVGTSLTGAIASAAPQVEGLAFALERAFKATRDFFEEINASGTQKLNFQIADINAEMAKLLALRDEAGKSGSGLFGFDPLGGTVARDLDEQISALREQRDELIQSRDSLRRLGKAQEAVTATAPPAAAAIEGVGDAAGGSAEKVEELTGAQRRLAQAGSILLQTSALEERFDRDAEAAAKLNSQQEALVAQQEQLRQERAREAQRQADLLAEPFRNFIRSAQSETADFWTDFYDGGIRSAEDVTDAIKSLFTRLAGELTALAIFQPGDVFGSSGLLSGFFGQQQSGASITEGLGATKGGQIGAGAGGTSFDFSGAVGGGLAGVGAGTAAGGAIGGQQEAAIGSAVGAVIGGIIGTYFGGQTAIGAFVGGTLGGLAGGAFAGSKGDKEVKFSGSGGLGAIQGGDQVGSFLSEIDRSIQDLLNSRQEALVNEVLRKTTVNVRGADFDPNVQAFAASQRIGPAARALGLDPRSITGNGSASAQAQLQNLQTALQVQREIEDLTGSVTAFERQLEDLGIQFEDLDAKAKRFGISVDGLAEAHERLTEDLAREQRAQLGALIDPFDQLLELVEGVQRGAGLIGLNPAEQFQAAQAEFERIAAEALGGSTIAIEQIAGASQDFLRLADATGASPGLARATERVAEVAERLAADITDARDDASVGIIDALDRNRREEIDTLQELIAEVRKVASKLDVAKI